VCSILAQDIQPEDEIVIVHDGPPEAWVEKMVADLGPQWKLFSTPHMNFGAYQEFGSKSGSGTRKRCVEESTKDYLVWQDDDDVFTDGAIEAIRGRCEAKPGHPLIFKFMVFDGIILWDEHTKGAVRESFITGQQMVAPNVEGRVGKCTDRRLYDHDFIRSTVDLYPGKEKDVYWCPELIGLWSPPFDIPERLEPFAPYVEAA
jgi:hypothetical protein